MLMKKTIRAFLFPFCSLVLGVAACAQDVDGSELQKSGVGEAKSVLLRDWPDGGYFYTFTKNTDNSEYTISRARGGVGTGEVVFVGKSPFLPGPDNLILKNIPSGAVRFLCEAWFQEILTTKGLESLKGEAGNTVLGDRAKIEGITKDVLSRYGVLNSNP